MSQTRISGSHRAPQTPLPGPSLRPGPGPEATRPPAAPANKGSWLRETFVSAVSNFRQPPPLGARPFRAEKAHAVSAMFAPELEALNARSSDAVAHDLAVTFLSFADHKEISAHAGLSEGFETLGELMRAYEHIRMLRAGDLG